MSNRPLYIGIDAGSSATKCVAIDGTGELLGYAVTPSGFDFALSAQVVLDQTLESCDAISSDVIDCVSTGYGRENVECAQKHVTEITCHARGAREWYPGVRNIIDIGGQDTKVIRLTADGQMEDYKMNAKCAAGTGTFLESIAQKLGCTLLELDELAMQATGDFVINSYCTVFAGTEVIECVKAGNPPEEIAMGLFRSISNRILEMIPAQSDSIAATGGVVAHCRAMRHAMEQRLSASIQLPPKPQLAGAFGAALLALERQKGGVSGRLSAAIQDSVSKDSEPSSPSSSCGGCSC